MAEIKKTASNVDKGYGATKAYTFLLGKSNGQPLWKRYGGYLQN